MKKIKDKFKREAYLSIVSTMRSEMELGHIDDILYDKGYCFEDSEIIQDMIENILDGFVERCSENV